MDGFPIDPLNVFSAASTTTVHFHDKFCFLHSPLYRFAIPAEEGIAVREETNCPALLPPGSLVFPLDGLYVLGLEALGALGDGKLDGLAFLQAAESV